VPAFQQQQQNTKDYSFAATFGLAMLLTVGISASESSKKSTPTDAAEKKWPVISRKEVQFHNCLDRDIWVTYKDSVYDITDFVYNHPGGKERLEGVAGQDIGEAWNLFRNHRSSPLAHQLLDGMKIGQLAPSEVIHVAEPKHTPVYSTDPVYDLIIVGAGLSGLQCGSALVNSYGVDKSKILVLEAQDYVGGRVKQMTEFIKGAKIEVGAEFLHGECSDCFVRRAVGGVVRQVCV
jgi:cytochrome b involved in lipid metabolism